MRVVLFDADTDEAAANKLSHSLPRQMLQQNAPQVHAPFLLIWSVRSVWFVWLNEIGQMNQINSCPSA